MGLFGRKRRKQVQDAELASQEGQDNQDAAKVEPSEDAPKHGPYDAHERDWSQGYLDFGPLKIPAIAGLQLQPQFAQDKKSVVRLGIVVGNSVLQVLVAAGPKSGGGWKKVLEGTKESFENQGAEVKYNENGPWGEEILALVPVKTQDGRPASSPTRVIGMDGDRWILRVDIMGPAAVEQKAFNVAATIINNLVVERDAEPRPPLSVITMTIPEELLAQKPVDTNLPTD